MMMMKLYTLLFTLLLGIPSLVASTESVSLGAIEMQIRSSTKTDPNNMIIELLSLSVQFLDDALDRHYQENSSYNFTKVRLSVKSYDVKPDNNDGYLAAVNLKGAASFLDQTPSSKDVVAVVTQAFSEGNQDFLEIISSASTDPFLTDISYAVIKVNEFVASEGEQASGTDDSDDGLETWIIAVIAGGSAFVGVLFICLLWLCCGSPEDSPPVRSRESKSTEEESNRSRSPSPVRSIGSQDSSVFTYNPKSTRSQDGHTLTFDANTLGGDTKSKGSSDINTLGGDTRSRGSVDAFNSFVAGQNGDFDVEAWQKGSTIKQDTSQIPFGHDISAIDHKKDLSLIEEGDNEDPTPEKHNAITKSSRQKSNKKPTYLSQNALQDLERQSRRKKRAYYDETAQEVLQELDDLSFQFSSRRSS